MTQLITDRAKPHTRPSWFHFTRHLVEMFLAMMAGMMVGAFLLATAVGTSVAEARRARSPGLWPRRRLGCLEPPRSCR